MDARAIITKIKHGETPSLEELNWFVKGLVDHSVSDAQAAAFAMAVCLNGMDENGIVSFTTAMRDSGDISVWKTDKPILDKHSTGGVGDCVSLVLAPLLASVDICVPMISGRGLGHTGGTLDKLEAIPGLRVLLNTDELQTVIDNVGCAIVSATSDIAPADKRLYAIRDVTATVDCLELITASILSKKLAAGLDGLILDVKCGTGAFMKSSSEARVLASALVKTANLTGCKTLALVSDMNEPLAPSSGNAVEIKDVLDVLVHAKVGRLKDLSLRLGAELMKKNGLCDTVKAGLVKLNKQLEKGHAAETFAKMVSAMGGPSGFVDDWSRYLPEAPVISEIFAPKEGYISGWNSEALGLCTVNLGGGRRVETDKINPAVGLSDIAAIGTRIDKSKPIARIHAARIEAADQAAKQVLDAMEISDKPPQTYSLIIEKIE
ncbi:MAG: thymidine phosphorylase [Paracoccaceae bacterium]|nr:thymidine phosphorylase [Paracoccaceae bacterium]